MESAHPELSGRVAGIVLCGGASRRMGSPKALLPFAGTSLLGYLVGRMKSICDPVVVVGQGGQADWAPPGCEFCPDVLPGGGPLVGLVSGLQWLDGRRELVQMAACDTPFYQPAVTGLLCRSMGEAMAAIPEIDGYLRGLNGLFRTECRLVLQDAIASGYRRIQDLATLIPVVRIPAERLAAADPGLLSFAGANTPEEYAQLKLLAESQAAG